MIELVLKIRRRLTPQQNASATLTIREPFSYSKSAKAGNIGRAPAESSLKPRSKPRNPTCFNCWKVGHLSSTCTVDPKSAQ